MSDAICLGCGARVTDDAPCACARVDPYRTVASDAFGACPRCKQHLVEEEYGGTQLDECVTCGGVFVDGITLDRLAQAHDERVSLSIALPVRARMRETSVHYLPCPRCHSMMNRRIYGRLSGIVVDVCKEHGIWFDAGELPGVIDFIESGGLERAKKREAEEQKERERQLKSQRAAAIYAPVPRVGNAERNELARELLQTIIDWWK